MDEKMRQHCQVVTKAAIRRPGSHLSDEMAQKRYLAAIAQNHPALVERGREHVRVIEKVVAEEALRRQLASPPVSPLESGRPLVEGQPVANWRRPLPDQFEFKAVKLTPLKRT